MPREHIRGTFVTGKRVAGVGAQRAYLELRIPAGISLMDVEVGAWNETGAPGAFNVVFRSTRFDAAAPAFTNTQDFGFGAPIQYVASNVALPAVTEPQRMPAGQNGDSMPTLFPFGNMHAPSGSDRFLVLYQQADGDAMTFFARGVISLWPRA